ncbi:MAG: cobaltochelatase subunit CobS, partial [Rhodospirillales bacterium]
MTTTQAAEAEASVFPLDVPDIKVSVRQTFGIDCDMDVPAFSKADAHVPALD